MGDELMRVEVPAGGATVELGDSADYEVDPNDWLLEQEAE